MARQIIDLHGLFTSRHICNRNYRPSLGDDYVATSITGGSVGFFEFAGIINPNNGDVSPHFVLVRTRGSYSDSYGYSPIHSIWSSEQFS